MRISRKSDFKGEKMGNPKNITRRDFIKQTSLAAVGSTLLLGKTGLVYSQDAKKVRVILVRDNGVLDEKGRPKYEVVLDMLDRAVTTLTGKKDVVQAWKTFIRADDVVGIKSNVWTYIPTTSQVENALKKRVMDAGVGESNIGIDDRGVLRNPIFKRSTALINARPMRSHHWAGVGTLIKNYIMFVPDPPNYHDDACSRLATIWDNPLCKGKTRLNVLVMLTPQFHGVGPHNFNPRYVWNYYGLIVSFDPVAADSTGLCIIQAKRRDFFGEDRPLSPPAKHIFEADTRYNLGTSDPNKIDLIKIGYEEDTFV
jgi:hypothetical protein